MFYRAIATLLSLASIASAIPTLYLAGDSTMAHLKGDIKQGYVVPMRPRVDPKPLLRWGEFISHYLSGLNIVNKAIAGRSARSFTREGRWREIQDLLKAGDYVIIEFGLCNRLCRFAERFMVYFQGTMREGLLRTVREHLCLEREKVTHSDT